VARDEAAIDEAVALLERLDLAGVMTRRTATLAYGRRRLLEVALALACRPKVLLLDEPAAGVPPGEREEIMQAVALLPREVTVVLIEHDMDLVFRFAERISVLVAGALFMEGTPEEVAASPKLREVYLGERLVA
jgi:branched-chain amino acid transport system ATP-binding protein